MSYNQQTKMSKLYKRNKNGSIQHWMIYIVNAPCGYVTEYGQVGGKTTISAPTFTEGKNIGRSNEKTPLEVAKDVAKKMRQDKLDSGYKDTIEEVTGAIEVEFRPTLAQKYNVKHLDDRVFVSPKLDGLRYLASKEGGVSRTNKRFMTTPHIRKALRDFFIKYPDAILDGELYNHEYKENFNKIMSLARKTKPTQSDLKEAKKKLELHIFDVYFPYAKETVTAGRQEFLRECFDRGLIKHPCVLVENIERHDLSDKVLEEIHAKHVEDGYEGTMLKNAFSVYEFTRTKNLQKYKAFEDDEFVITDITEGVGKRAGMMGRIHLKTKGGLDFGSGARGNDAFFTDLFKNKEKYIGKLATIRYQNLTPDGIPRFPVMVAVDRPDAL